MERFLKEIILLYRSSQSLQQESISWDEKVGESLISLQHHRVLQLHFHHERQTFMMTYNVSDILGVFYTYRR